MDKNRIIGDFLEINSDIVQAEFESKLPRFLKKFKYKKQRKRLLENLDKLKNSEMILETDNLIELFSYVYNNYPDTSYRSIKKCKIDQESGIYEAIVQVDNQTSIITIEEDRYPKFNINSRIYISDSITEGIDIEVERLFSDNEKKNNILYSVNKTLREDMCTYIEEIIKPYYENKERDDGLVEESVLTINVE